MIRRIFMAAALGLIASAALAAPSEIAPGVWLQSGNFTLGSQPDGNSIIFDAPRGLIVVDTGRHQTHTRLLIDFAAQRDKKIAAVINTHWHLDHVGGNATFRKELPEVRIYATGALKGALDGFLAKYREFLVGAIPKAADKPEQQSQFRNELALIDAGEQLRPDEVITASGRKRIAGSDLELFVANRAATEGDLWLFDEKTGVLVAGDLITLPAPFLDTACPAGMKSALDTLAKKNFKVAVPGHGAPMTRAEVETYRAAFSSLLECGASKEPTAHCTDRWLSALGDLIPESDHAFTRELMAYYIENHLRGDPAQTARLCGS